MLMLSFFLIDLWYVHPPCITNVIYLFFFISCSTMLVHSRFTSTALEKFILDKCKKSVHFALQVCNYFFKYFYTIYDPYSSGISN